MNDSAEPAAFRFRNIRKAISNIALCPPGSCCTRKRTNPILQINCVDRSTHREIGAGSHSADATSSAQPPGDDQNELVGDIRGLKIAVPRDYYFDLVTEEVLALLNGAMTGLRDLGATMLGTRAPEMALINGLAQTVMAVEAATIHRE